MLPEEEEIIGWLPCDEIEPEEWEEMPIMMLAGNVGTINITPQEYVFVLIGAAQEPCLIH